MFKKNLDLYLAIALVLVVVFAFFPTVLNNSRLYKLSKLVILGLLFLMAFFSRCYEAFKDRFLRKSVIIALISGVTVFALYSFSLRIGWYDTTSLLIVIFAISIGYSMKLSELQLEGLLLVYGVSSIVLGVYSMVYYVGAVTLADYMYAVETKNLVGQIVATASVGLVVTLVDTRYRVLKYLLIGIILVLLIVLRCKTALLAFVLFVLYYYRKSFKSSFALIVALSLIILGVIYSSQIYSFLETLFIGGKEIADINDLTSDRLDRDIDGIDFFLSHPLFGELKYESGIANIHNYVIKRLAGYGLFSLPFMVFYFFYLFFCIKEWKNLKDRRMRYAGLLALIIPMFSSFVEPSAPFGPGLVQIIPFLLFGIYLGPGLSSDNVGSAQ